MNILLCAFFITLNSAWHVCSQSVGLIRTLSIGVASIYHTTCIDLLYHSGTNEAEMNTYFRLMRDFASTEVLAMYSMETKEKSMMEPRRCTKPLRITIGDKQSRLPFSEMSHKSSNTFTNPVTLVFLKNQTIQEFFRDVNLPYHSMVICVKILRSDLLELYEVFRVDTNFPLRIHRIGNWTNIRGAMINPRTVFSRRYDFEGKLFRTGSMEKWPLSTFNGFLDKDEPWDGLYCSVWRQLQMLLNFTSVNFKGDHSGVQQPDGRWNGLSGMLLNGEIDVIVSELRLTENRLRVMDFTYPLITSWYQIYYRAPGYSLQWFAMFKPFNHDVWEAILGWIVLGTICLSICFSWSMAHGLEQPYKDLPIPLTSFFFIIRSLCLQGSNTVPQSMVCRILFLVAYMNAAVLMPSYSASLISSLTQRSPIRPFDSLEELLWDDTYKLYVEENTAEYTYFSRATDKTLKAIFKNLVVPMAPIHFTNYSSFGLEMICKKKNMAVFEIQKVMRLKNIALCEILSLTQPLTKVQEGMAMMKGDPFAPYIHHHVHRMREAGLVDRLENRVAPRFHKGISPWTPVEMEEVFQILVLLILGIIISVAILICERKYASRVRKTESKKKYFSAKRFYFEYPL